jgi:hypothetical protein
MLLDSNSNTKFKCLVPRLSQNQNPIVLENCQFGVREAMRLISLSRGTPYSINLALNIHSCHSSNIWLRTMRRMPGFKNQHKQNNMSLAVTYSIWKPTRERSATCRSDSAATIFWLGEEKNTLHLSHGMGSLEMQNAHIPASYRAQVWPQSFEFAKVFTLQ